MPIRSNIWLNPFHNRFSLFIRANQKMIVVPSLITLIKLLSLLMCSTTHLDEELCLSRYSRSLLLLSSRRWYLLYFFQLVKLEQILLITVLILKLVSLELYHFGEIAGIFPQIRAHSNRFFLCTGCPVANIYVLICSERWKYAS